MAFRLILSFMLLCLSTMLCAQNIAISDYKPTYLPISKDGTFYFAIRVFKKDDIPSFLIVNPTTLETSITPISQVAFYRASKKEIGETRYQQLLEQFSAPPYIVKNYGVTHSAQGKKGNILTIDMCQSSKPFEKQFFERLASLGNQKPVPIAICMSGIWLQTHEKEFKYLLNFQKDNKLAITWVNHSFSHPYFPDLKDNNNFLLAENVNLENEILSVEQYLLEKNQIPSVFFRFPGLVSNKKLILKLKEFGLLPLGTDGWIAKEQPITEGGILLVHGNGNEPEGIVKLLPKLEFLNLIPLNGNI